MTDSRQTPPAFPDARAKNLNTKKSIWLIALFGVMAVMLAGGIVGSLVGYLGARSGQSFDITQAAWPLVLFALATMIPTNLWSLKYWKSIDEMAKRAHLDAFFWGGGVISWAIYLPLVLPALALPTLKFGPIENLDISSTHAFGLGVFATVMVTSLCYTIFWLFWWAKKR